MSYGLSVWTLDFSFLVLPFSPFYCLHILSLVNKVSIFILTLIIPELLIKKRTIFILYHFNKLLCKAILQLLLI